VRRGSSGHPEKEKIRGGGGGTIAEKKKWGDCSKRGIITEHVNGKKKDIGYFFVGLRKSPKA